MVDLAIPLVESTEAIDDNNAIGEYALTRKDYRSQTIGKLKRHINKVPLGGTAGQVLQKATNNDFDVRWTDAAQDELPVGGSVGQVLKKKSSLDGDVVWGSEVTGVPDGGNRFQVLTKDSNADGDVDWNDVPTELPTGGTAGQVLAKTSSIDYAVGWTDAGSGGGITLPSGGTAGQVLVRTATGTLEWANQSGGLDQDAVDARVTALVEDFAEVGNAAEIPYAKYRDTLFGEVDVKSETDQQVNFNMSANSALARLTSIGGTITLTGAQMSDAGTVIEVDWDATWVGSQPPTSLSIQLWTSGLPSNKMVDSLDVQVAGAGLNRQGSHAFTIDSSVSMYIFELYGSYTESANNSQGTVTIENIQVRSDEGPGAPTIKQIAREVVKLPAQSGNSAKWTKGDLPDDLLYSSDGITYAATELPTNAAAWRGGLGFPALNDDADGKVIAYDKDNAALEFIGLPESSGIRLEKFFESATFAAGSSIPFSTHGSQSQSGDYPMCFYGNMT